MRARQIVPLVSILAGCQFFDQPKKVAAIEHKLDELSKSVAELKGEEPEAEPPEKGKGKGKPKEAKGGKEAKEGKEAKAKPKAKAHDDAHDEGHDDAPAEESDAHEEPEEHAAPAKPDAHWGYRGEHGPDNWGGTCQKGSEQSPIDILPRAGAAKEVVFVYKPTAGTVVDNGHTLQVDLGAGSYIVVDGTRFDLVQFHMHTPSEHTIAGEHYPLEVHLVHKNREGALAVVGVLYDEGEPAKAMAAVWKSAPRHEGKAKLSKPFDPEQLLPAQRTAYRYDGSLTTPPCSEGVSWIVLRRTRTEDAARIAGFRERFGENARPVQELGERELR